MLQIIAKSTLIAIFLTLSLTGMTCSQTKSTPPPAVIVCEDSAFVNPEDFKVEKLTSKDDKEFHQWANKIITQQPTLLGAYSDLRECWDYYHGTTRTTK